MKKLILIKLGGSVITDKSQEYCAREENIARLAKEIESVRKTTHDKIIIGHGAGSFAHIPAKKYKTKDGIINSKSLLGASVTEEAAKTLNAIVVKKFISEKIPVYSFSPGTFLISDTKVYIKSYIDPIKKALEIGIVAIVYGDVVFDRKIGFTIFSTEKILSILASELIKDYKIRVVYLTDVDGVIGNSGKVIPRINNSNFDKLKPAITGARGVDVTGGMLHKVEESLNLAAKTGIKTLIVNGLKEGNLKKAVVGENFDGTLIG